MRWWQRKHRERDMDRELLSHLDLEAEERQGQGLSPEDARHAAIRALGNVVLVKEDVREAWGRRSLERLWQDLAYAWRLFKRAPGFTAIVILTLAFGIGANTAVFVVVNAVLLQPLPYPGSDRLIAIWDREKQAKGPSKLFDLYSDYQNIRDHSRTFEAVAAVSWSPQASPSKILRGAGPPRGVFALPVTADFFSLVNVPPLLGRTFDKRDVDRGCVLVLTHDFWQSTFGGRREVVNQTIRLDDKPCDILGVMPPRFAFLPPEAPVTMWTLMPVPKRPDQFAVGVFARLRPGVSFPGAQAEVSLLHNQLHEHDRWGAQNEPLIYPLHDEFTWLTSRTLRLSLIVLFAAVTFVLLICCLNVANLLLSRSVARKREIAIRAALGSGRARLLRQLLTENLLLSISGSIAGAVLAAVAIRYFRAIQPVAMPPGTLLQLTAPVFAFTAILSVLTALLFGLLPAWRASHVNLNDALKVGSKSSSQGVRQHRFGKGLIVAEVMLTMVLLVGAGLLTQSMLRIGSAPLGFSPEGLLTTSVGLSQIHYPDPESRLQFYERLRVRLNEIPGVQGIAFSSMRPFVNSGGMEALEVEGLPAPPLGSPSDTFQQTISPDYFNVMNSPLLKGRAFDSRDRRGDPVVIVNESLARKYFPDANPIGGRIRPFVARSGGNRSAPWWRIVGLAPDEKRPTVYEEMAWVASPLVYHPFQENPPLGSHILIRAYGEKGTTGASIQRTLSALDPDIPVDEIKAVPELASRILAYPRFRAILLASFAGLALLLAIVGLFGVLAHLVAQRTHEIGVRMALGAQRASVLAMVLKEGLVLTGTGIVLGLGVALLITRYFSALLYNVKAADPLLLAAIALLLLTAAMGAIYLPARRASKVDPIVALKYE